MTNNTSLQEKVGQLLAVGIHGTALSDAGIQQVVTQAEAGQIGGIIIYRYNITSNAQLATLLQGIRRARTALPLFVYVDQEGGKIQRLDSSHGFVEIEGTPISPEVYKELLLSYDAGVAEFLDLEAAKPNTLGNSRMLLTL